MNQRFQCKWNARLIILIDCAEFDSAFSLNRGIQFNMQSPTGKQRKSLFSFKGKPKQIRSASTET